MPRKPNLEMRSLILREGSALFLEQGYGETTMRQIAQRCGISQSLLQHYYAKKENILVQFFHNILGEVDEYVLRDVLRGMTLKGDYGMALYVNVTLSLFYHLLIRDGGKLLALYTEILYNTPLIMRGVAYASSQFSYDAKAGGSSRAQRGNYMLTGVLSQYVALYLSAPIQGDFTPVLNEAFAIYNDYLGLLPAEQREIVELRDSRVGDEQRQAVVRLYEGIRFRFIDDPFL